VRGWVFLQGGDDFEAIDYSGSRHATIAGWPNAWLWSPDGQHAAQIKMGKVSVFRPSLPDPIE
jgi:hypothetical protein